MKTLFVWLGLLIAGLELFFGIKFLMFNSQLCLAQSWWSGIVPMPGAMTKLSWLVIFTWLVAGILLALAADGIGKKLILPLVIVAWFVFLQGVVNADSRCHRFFSCGEEFNKSVEAVLGRAFNHLQPDVCSELTELAEVCGASDKLLPVEECQRRINSIEQYQQALLDVSACQKNHTDCQAEYFKFYYDNLSNDISSAQIQCEQKFNNNIKQSDLCRQYLNVWQSKGLKPISNQ